MSRIKFLLANKGQGVIDSNNPIVEDDLFLIEQPSPEQISQDNDLKVLQIPIAQLTATPTNENIKALVAEWAVTYAPTKLDIETFAWETIDDNVVITWADASTWNDTLTWTE